MLQKFRQYDNCQPPYNNQRPPLKQFSLERNARDPETAKTVSHTRGVASYIYRKVRTEWPHEWFAINIHHLYFMVQGLVALYFVAFVIPVGIVIYQAPSTPVLLLPPTFEPRRHLSKFLALNFPNMIFTYLGPLSRSTLTMMNRVKKASRTYPGHTTSAINSSYRSAFSAWPQ